MALIAVTFDEVRKKDGKRHAVKGVAVGWVTRAKKVCAIVLVRRSLVAVPLSELKVIKR